MDALPYDAQRLRHLAGELITNVRELAQAGWTPATSSNFSQRLDARHAAITVSGRDMAEARRHLEAFEFLLGCELDLGRLQ